MTSLMMISVTGGLGQPLTCDMDQRSYFILLLIIRVIVINIILIVIVISAVVIVIRINKIRWRLPLTGSC